MNKSTAKELKKEAKKAFAKSKERKICWLTALLFSVGLCVYESYQMNEFDIIWLVICLVFYGAVPGVFWIFIIKRSYIKRYIAKKEFEEHQRELHDSLLY